MRKIKQKLIQGISLLEVLLSLSIIAIILVMATRYFFVASNNNKVNTTRQDIGSLIAAITSWKNENPVYPGDLSISTLVTDGFLTNTNNIVDNALYDPWGGEIVLSVSTAGAEISDTFASDPNGHECISLQNSYPAATCNGNQFSITIN